MSLNLYSSTLVLRGRPIVQTRSPQPKNENDSALLAKERGSVSIWMNPKVSSWIPQITEINQYCRVNQCCTRLSRHNSYRLQVLDRTVDRPTGHWSICFERLPTNLAHGRSDVWKVFCAAEGGSGRPTLHLKRVTKQAWWNCFSDFKNEYNGMKTLRGEITAVKLWRTDTTLDLSLLAKGSWKEKKGWNVEGGE